MGGISVISVFANRSITKNASIINTATPIYLGRLGPNSMFWADINASGGEKVGVTYQICDTPEGTFYKPVGATILNRWKAGYGGNTGASRDRVAVDSIVGTKWIKFKVDELNASPITNLNLDLVISA